MVGFAGYEMPLQYPLGVLREHLHTRARAGLFDVSHMGQIELHGAEAAHWLETLAPADIVGLAPGRQRYTVFTNDAGGVCDDLMVANVGSHLQLVVNAACKAADLALLESALDGRCQARPREDLALLALQGPRAEVALSEVADAALPVAFMQGRHLRLDGIPCWVTRSGYTGEDGFEISLPAESAEALARRLLRHPDVAPIGLGARDSLRLEAGLCLYGHDLDPTTTPTEAALTWAIPKARRSGGVRAGGFPGADRILAEIDDPSRVARRRVGLLPEGRAPIREGVVLIDATGREVGRVSSGGFAPTRNGPVMMAYVATPYAAPGTRLAALLRGSPVPAVVVELPFVPHRYRR